MDSIFHLEDGDRSAFLEQMMQAFGCVYICLKYYVPPPYNCLRGFDGIYHERRNQEIRTSQGSLARRLFDVYRESSTYPDTARIPGIAFTSNNPCMKLELHEFQRLVSSDFQLQFYQEAGIKTVILMGCATGEIELGMSDIHPQVDVESEMKNFIRINFPHRIPDPNQPPSSSSSSLRSLSVDSPEYPPLIFTTPPQFLPPPPQETLAIYDDAALTPSLPLSSPPITSTTTSAAENPHEKDIQILSQFRSSQFPSIESENAAMTNAILVVLSSPSTSSSSHQNLPPPPPRRNLSIIPTAFRRYHPDPAPRFDAAAPKQSKFKRAVLFLRNLRQMRNRSEFPVHGTRPSDTQLHHMISERRRRERLNESFHILRSFLPPGTKKDKASVLSSTTEYMSSLKSQVAELKKRNLILESQLSSTGRSEVWSSSGERVSVEMTQVASSSSSSEVRRSLELRVRVRGGKSSLLDLVIRVSEFLRSQNNVSLTSVESNTRLSGSDAVHVLIIRLTIEGDEFDESGFEEGVRRVVDDDDGDDHKYQSN